MAMAKQGGEENIVGHVAICPFPFASHTQCLFNLGIRLANEAPETGFSFLTTGTSKHTIISSTISLPTNLKIYTIADGIPKEEDDHNNNNNNNLAATAADQQDHTNHYHMHCFNMAMPDNFKQGIDMAVKENNGKKISYIIADTFSATGVVVISKEMKVPWVALWFGCPFAFHPFFRMEHIYQLSLQLQLAHDDHDQLIPGFSPLRFTDLPEHALQPSGGGWTFFLPMMRALPEASAIIMNAYQELCVSHDHDIGTWNNIVVDGHGAEDSSCLEPKLKKLLFVGCLTLPITNMLPSSLNHEVVLPVDDHDANDNDMEGGGIFPWLERQRAGSVVYVSFGTVTALCDEETTGLAEALEVYKFPFLWSLKESHRGRLPCGFVERTGKYGKVVSWAPQAQVLKHGAIGVFVTHSGYNSVVESILGGVPLICRSVWADNHIMRRWVEEVWGIGVGVEGGVITKDGMCRCLQAAFREEKGMKMRANVAALRDKMLEAAGPNGIANKDFQALLQMMHACT